MKNIKIGACDWALPGNGLYAARIAADFGLDAISLKLGLYANDYPLTYQDMQKNYLEDQQRYGVEYCAVALNDFDNIPMHARRNTKEYEIVWDMLGRTITTAKNLRIPLIQVPAFGASEMKTEEDMFQSAEVFRYLCDEAGEWGISIASENDLEPDQFKKLYQMVDRENFYLYFDSQNYHVKKGFDPVMILEKLYPYMCNQVHVKDGETLSGGLLGTGSSGFFKIMDWLDKHYYGGYILLENYYDMLPLRTQAESPYDLLEKDIRILRETIARTEMTA